METRRLLQLEAIARHGTISGAAEELHMSQPALSRSVSRLEDELGQPLLNRNGRHVSLNSAGRVVVDYAHIILREERLMRTELNRITQRSSTIAIGSVAPAPLRVLVSRALDLDIENLMSTKTLGVNDVERALLEGRVDLAVGLGKATLPSVESRPFMHERLFVAVPTNHPIAKQDKTTFSEMDGETFLLQAHVGFWGRLVRRMMPHSIFVVQENRAEYLAMAHSGKTATFVSDAGTDAHEADGRCIVPIADKAAHATYHLLMRADAHGLIRTLFDSA